MATKVAANMGIDVSTTGIAVRVRSSDGEEGFVSQPFPPEAKTTWFEQPAYYLDPIPKLLVTLIKDLIAQDWTFRKSGAMVFSIRQHDMVLLNLLRQPKGPAISWESNVAQAEAAALNKNPAVLSEVGPVAARYIVPKLQWLLRRDPSLRNTTWLCTTGDYIRFSLTGNLRLASSDGRSNGLVTKAAPAAHAEETMRAANLNPGWLPDVINSGQIIGEVLGPSAVAAGPWQDLACLLHGWRVGASLGDNHAAATGFLMTDTKTLCLSAGSSGPSTRLVGPATPLANNVLCMEYFDQCMLLAMLGRCCVAYDEWFATLPGKPDHATVDAEALEAELKARYLVTLHDRHEEFPTDWTSLSRGSQAAHLQVSLALGMLKHTQAVLAETESAEIMHCFLTGGLSMSPLFRHAIVVGVDLLLPDCPVYVSSLKGDGRFQMAARGAMFTSMLPDGGGTVAELANLGNLCPRVKCEDPGKHQEPLMGIMQPRLVA